jgi:uncharacterized protein YheU (UPF0270 family)
VDVTGLKKQQREEGLSQGDEAWELDYLVKEVKKSMENGNKSIIIFAETKRTIDKICEALR